MTPCKLLVGRLVAAADRFPGLRAHLCLIEARVVCFMASFLMWGDPGGRNYTWDELIRDSLKCRRLAR